jgi:hypothetical protein
MFYGCAIPIGVGVGSRLHCVRANPAPSFLRKKRRKVQLVSHPDLIGRSSEARSQEEGAGSTV